MDFDQYLKSKKIDPEKFAQAEKDRFFEWKEIFGQVHPQSFTSQKLFLINSTRRRYPLLENQDTSDVVKKKISKPKVKIRPK